WYEIAPAKGIGRTRRLGPEEVVHFGRGTDPEGPAGVSPLESCRYTLALHEAVMRSLFAWFGNAMQPSGHLEVDSLTKEKAREIREMIVEAYASPENAGSVLVTSGKWASRAETPEHSEVVELIRLSREEIAAAYSVPPPVLGILDKAIKANVKELREQYVRDSLGSWAPEFEAEIEAQLLPLTPSWRNLFTRFQLSEQLRPDLEARSAVYQRMKHVLSIDRMRELEDEEPLDIPGVSDVPWVDSGALPITRAGQSSAFAAGPSTDELADAIAARLFGSRNGHTDPSEVIP
ncbi:MAG: phage portal protein, partial [Gemmatimonadota bacterium]